MDNSCSPDASNIIHTSDGQPAVGSPNINLRITTNIIIKNEIKQNSTPTKEDMDNSVVEYAVRPSNAYFHNCQNDHLV